MTNITLINGGKDNKTIEPEYKKFQVMYRFEDRNWCFQIYAKDSNECDKRISDIKHFPVEVSEIIEEIQ